MHLSHPKSRIGHDFPRQPGKPLSSPLYVQYSSDWLVFGRLLKYYPPMNRIVSLFLALIAIPAAHAAEPLQSAEFLSRTFEVDGIYRSMEGPSEVQTITLLDSDEPELLWIRAIRSEIVAEDGKTPMSGEFMCHVNMDIDPESHRDAFNLDKPYINSRLMTLAQGQFAVEFPKGFGAPLMSDEPLYMNSQVLNHNIEGSLLNLRHRIVVDYVRDKDLGTPMNPLFVSAPFGMKLLSGTNGYYGLSTIDPALHGQGCLMGAPADNSLTSSSFADQFGKKFTGHWKVKPGREVNHTPVTALMAVPFDTTIHYIAVHLHPFAESVELIDLTENRSVFRSNAENTREGIGLASVETYSSKVGIPVYKDHEYELISVYDNPTSENHDAMATVFLYLLDKEFSYPQNL